MPKKTISKIDKEKFEDIYRLPISVEEICEYFFCTREDLDKFCLTSYRASLDQKLAHGRADLKICLLEGQIQMAQKNSSMAMWLGRQYLDQQPNPIDRPAHQHEDDGLWSSISEAVKQNPS
jgi:hypothetical protein